MAWLVEREGLSGRVRLDSAGTGGWHAGEPPDPRSTEAAKRRGIPLAGAARQFELADFERFDHIVAMDRSNLRNLRRLAPDDGALARLSLLRDFDPASPRGSDVPDPYFDGPQGFDEVVDICIAGCEGLLADLRERHGL